MQLLEFLKKEKRKVIGFIHHNYIILQKKKKIYSASIKTKSDVRGGGKKPWKQKGTGLARTGSLRSPLFVGGGIIFGPKQKVVTIKINKIECKLAFLLTLYLNSYKFFTLNKINNILILKIVTFLKKISIVILLLNYNYFLFLKLKNYPYIKITTIKTCNLQNLLTTKCIIYCLNKI